MPRRLRMPTRDELPDGPVRVFVDELHMLWRAARRPDLRTIESGVESGNYRGSISREQFRRMLWGTAVPSNWDNVEAVFLFLCELANIDPDGVKATSGPLKIVTYRDELLQRWHEAYDALLTAKVSDQSPVRRPTEAQPDMLELEGVGVKDFRPMRATRGPLPHGKEWAYEFSWSGLRCIAHVHAEAPRIVEASGLNVTQLFPELSLQCPSAVVLDGLVTAIDNNGRPNSGLLMRRLINPAAPISVAFYVVDILYAHGESTTNLTYEKRREVLAGSSLDRTRAVVPTAFSEVSPEAVTDTARRYGLNGVIAKRLDSLYEVGRESEEWVSGF